MPRSSRIKPGYRAVTTLLREQDMAEMERIADVLRRLGWVNVNRSFVIRAALVCFSDALRGKSPEDILRFFAERTARRAPQTAIAPIASSRALART